MKIFNNAEKTSKTYRKEYLDNLVEVVTNFQKNRANFLLFYNINEDLKTPNM